MDQFFVGPQHLLTAMGVWPLEISFTWKIFYLIFFFINTFCVTFWMNVSSIMYIYINSEDLMEVAEGVYFFLTQITFLSKLVLFVCLKYGKFVKLVKYSKSSVFATDNFVHKKYLKSWVAVGTIYKKIFLGGCVVCIIFYAVYPFLDQGAGRVLPFSGWYPFDVSETSNLYYIAFAMQMWGICVNGSTNASLDLAPCVLMNFACAQIDILKDNLENVIKRTEEQDDKEIIENVKEVYVRFENSYALAYIPLTKDQNDKVISILRKCVIHHEAINKLLLDTEEIFSPGMFFQFITNCITTCVTGVMLITVPAGSLKFFTIVMYFFAIVCEITLYCFNGHQVLVQSSTIGDSCYAMEWYRCDLRVKKMLLIIMERCKRPVKLSAGGFFILSMFTFTSIMRTSYSYFTVLRTVF